jgi:hypothetical protein
MLLIHLFRHLTSVWRKRPAACLPDTMMTWQQRRSNHMRAWMPRCIIIIRQSRGQVGMDVQTVHKSMADGGISSVLQVVLINVYLPYRVPILSRYIPTTLVNKTQSRFSPPLRPGLGRLLPTSDVAASLCNDAIFLGAVCSPPLHIAPRHYLPR